MMRAPVRHPWHRRLACLAALAACAAAAPLGACGLTPKPTTAARSGGTLGATPFEPVSLRVHPLTRIRDTAPNQDSGRSVDLYFELLDRWDHGVKALGTLTVEFRAVAAGGRRDPFQVRTWTVAMTDPDRNSAAYDRVTRTYHLTLADAPAAMDSAELRVRFRTTRGRDVASTYAIRPSPSTP